MNLPETVLAPLGNCGASDKLGIGLKPHSEERLFNNYREQTASPDQPDSIYRARPRLCAALLIGDFGMLNLRYARFAEKK
jgi:hypothetical protein